MESLDITTQARSLFEEIRQTFPDGSEYWSARALRVIIGYKDWENFVKVIKKAVESCENAGIKATDHFLQSKEMIDTAKGAHRSVPDILLSRYACYLIAQNGSPRVRNIALAQTYFAIQTRKAEEMAENEKIIERLEARHKLSETEKVFSSVAFDRDVDSKGLGKIKSDGDKVLFGGNDTKTMKVRLKIPQNRPLADFLNTVLIKGKDFAASMTIGNVLSKDLKGARPIGIEHNASNKEVRKALEKRGFIPEDIPPEEDIKKVERKIKQRINKKLRSTSVKIQSNAKHKRSPKRQRELQKTNDRET